MKGAVLSSQLLQARIAQLADQRLAVEERDGLLGSSSPEDLAAKRSRRRAALVAGRVDDARGALHHLGAGRTGTGELNEIGVVDDGLGHLTGALRQRQHLLQR